MTRTDVAIVGAGIAGAGLAAELAPHLRVTLIEAEDQPGRHATGRSAAFWTETYGGPDVRPLTSASATALAPFLRPRGALHLGREADARALDDLRRAFDGSVALEPVDPAALVPGLHPAWSRALLESSCADIDVAALHARFLRTFRRHGGVLLGGAPLLSAGWTGTGWRIEAGGTLIDAALLVNAAGAWADEIAIIAGATPLGLRAYRRTVVQLRTDPAPPADLPLVIDISGRFYFKPEAGGRVWLSPHDETPAEPGDAAPEEFDIAEAIDRLERVVDWRVEAVEHAWAGLRTFAPDRLPVYGFDPALSGFFWCVGQGGFGIQTAPAASAMAAAIILGRDQPVPEIDPARYRPDRFSRG